MSKSIISSLVLFVALAIGAPAYAKVSAGKPTKAHAFDWCGPRVKDNIATTPTPGKWYRITAEDDKASRKLSKKEDRILKHLFGDYSNVVRASRREARLAYPGSLVCVPVVAKGEVWTPMPKTYAPAEDVPRAIVVSLKDQFLGAYEYGKLVASFPIASGKSPKPTPVGDFKVMAKDKLHKSSLYEKDGEPWPMPNAVKFTVFQGGAIWFHQGTLPGRKASHGCVRLLMEDSLWLFNWAQLGDPVFSMKSL